MNDRTCSLSLLCLSLALGSSLAHAEQWYVEPRAILQTFYDDNVRLTTRGERETAGATIQANVKSGRRTEISDIQLGGRLTSRRYFEASDLDETDASMNALASYRLGRSSFEVQGALDYDSTLTSEVSTSGYVQANKRRIRLFAQPTWTYMLTPRATLELSASYQDVSYEDVDVIPLYDYDYTTAGLTFIYALSERAQASLRATFDRYDASETDLESETRGMLLGMSYQLSETLSLSAFTGVRNSTSRYGTWLGVIETDSSGPLFEVELKKRFEVGSLSLSAQRSMLPSGDGQLLDTTSLSLSYDYPLGPRWTLGLNADAYRNRNSDDDSSSSDRDYFSISPRLGLKLTEELNLALSYRYRLQKYDFRDEEAVSNSIYLNLTYVFPRQLIGK
ncbi:porin family protein [Imhoffiella purpurea]|uniref:BamA/TamA family outer membrane protein n=1 Tax=Imhoffiella purpurea TaxID=1249627 RepID=UPI0012FD18C7|nr:BamA/TamA family outer membrane protein [Imhoffiella purpurea]